MSLIHQCWIPKGPTGLPCINRRIFWAAEYPIAAHNLMQELTDFDFAISLIAMRNARYSELFATKQRYRIVDSGIFEDPHNPITPLEHVRTAEKLQGDEVIAVDLINDCHGTLSQMEAFLALSTDFPFLIQGVVQGSTLKEWLYCYHQFESNPRVAVIGLAYFDVPTDLKEGNLGFPEVTDAAEKARLTLLHLIASGVRVKSIDGPFEIVGPPTKPIHILGIRHLQALPYYTNLPYVRSIDTSFAVQLGVEGRPLRMDSVKPATKVNYEMVPSRAENALIAMNALRLGQLCRGNAVDLTNWLLADNSAGFPL